MDIRFSVTALAVVAATMVGASPAHAINHTTDYKTNMGNYRTCTDPLLESCDFAEVLSPSKFYLPSGTTTTVIHKDDGTVQLRIDAGGILTDSGISYTCSDENFACVGGLCTGPKAPNTACTVNICIGGTNEGGACNNSSACPGGSCTGGTTCLSQTCHGGSPRDHLECGTGKPACTSVADTSGWNLVFRGNNASWTYVAPSWHFLLRGDGESGCMKVCPFSLGSTGAINSSGLSCSQVGYCGNPMEAFHYVELRDPDDEVLAIPTAGPAQIVPGYLAVEGDPAQVGDCSRPTNAAFCP